MRLRCMHKIHASAVLTIAKTILTGCIAKARYEVRPAAEARIGKDLLQTMAFVHKSKQLEIKKSSPVIQDCNECWLNHCAQLMNSTRLNAKDSPVLHNNIWTLGGCKHCRYSNIRKIAS
mmetsp:Transcript_113706/g.178913  ORF Transcript_113706/g.178913 Transcript_113706/m.178913 type:complete len:119 (-) Transcript_113706:499-855(-)